MRFNRRQTLGLLAATGAAPRLAFAAAGGDRRLVVLLLRGGLDGLSLVPPLSDPDYAAQRRALAVEDALGFADGFGLHPAMAKLAANRTDLLVAHATATPYRDRSHFDGQDVLEAGLSDKGRIRDGWLARALERLPAQDRAIAINRSLPLIVKGSSKASNWSPSRLPEPESDLMDRLSGLYGDDALLSDGLARARMASAMAGEDRDMRADAPGDQPGRALLVAAEAVGNFLTDPQGPRVAVLDYGGWDTHAGQVNQLAVRFAALDRLLEALRTQLAPVWDRTLVLGLTEFGRRVAANGTGGTDHGVGGVAFLYGGAVAGGRVIADWPGLSGPALFEGRDLAPTLDTNRLIGGVLHDHLQLPTAAIRTGILPDTGTPLTGLVRA